MIFSLLIWVIFTCLLLIVGIVETILWIIIVIPLILFLEIFVWIERISIYFVKKVIK